MMPLKREAAILKELFPGSSIKTMYTSHYRKHEIDWVPVLRPGHIKIIHAQISNLTSITINKTILTVKSFI